LASLSLGTTNAANGPTLRKAEVDIGLKDGQTSREFSVVIMAMRKIREAIVASSRIDAFAASAYSFIIRATIMEKHVESYHPALLHLLRKLYNTSSCSASEKHEFVGYYILDLACRQSDLAGAFAARNMYDFRGTRVELVLKALVHGNWSVYWKSKRSVNEFQKRLMELGEAPMRKHALKCLGRSYLSASMLYVEEATGMHWKELKDQETLGWEQDGEMIIIKQIKRK